MIIFISILQHQTTTRKSHRKMTTLNYHIVPKDFPNDILNYVINGYIADLFFIDHKKDEARDLAYEAVKELQFRLREQLQYAEESLYYAQEYKDIGEDEQKHGPQGDRGNYICHNYQSAIDTYQHAVKEWNAFVEDYKDVKHLLPQNRLEPI